jgi:hypothetical protein
MPTCVDVFSGSEASVRKWERTLDGRLSYSRITLWAGLEWLNIMGRQPPASWIPGKRSPRQKLWPASWRNPPAEAVAIDQEIEKAENKKAHACAEESERAGKNQLIHRQIGTECQPDNDQTGA